MDMTLDECLAEVDRWRAKIVERPASMTPKEWEQESAGLRRWMNEKLGCPLPESSEREMNSSYFSISLDRPMPVG
ncbi:MAG: hypothetical protein BroJett003_09170 [Planctomycetota bacterium]|nr:MAG: hypothetical protein BroJett003_09170 [Planctomycetota bacterium]